MGAKDSKLSILSYEDAVQRVTKTELSRLQDAYKRACTFTGVMRENVLTRDVLGDVVPPKLAQRIFEVMSSSSRGMTQRDLITTLVLLARGKQEERLKLTYAVYSDYNGSFVTRRSMALMVTACEGSALPHEAAKLFEHSDRVSVEIFCEWLRRHPNITSVTRWLLSSGGVTVSLTDSTEMPNFYQTLAGVTHLEESSIIDLEKHYWTLKSQSKTGRFDMQTFKSIVCPPLPESIVEGLFNAFDENGDNHIDFKEISCGVSACCRGPLAEKQKFCFKVFDKDQDGKLNQEELKSMAISLLEVQGMSKKNGNIMDGQGRQSAPTNLTLNFTQGAHNDLNNVGRNAQSPIAEDSSIIKIADSKFFSSTSLPSKSKKLLTNAVADKSSVENSEESSEGKLNDDVDYVVSSAMQYAVDKEGSLTLEEYQMWGMDDPWPNKFLNIVIEICHIVLGLRPQSPVEEGMIIRGWMERSNYKEVKPGETWYVIASEWWKKWKKYTVYDPILSSSLSRKWEHEALESDVINHHQYYHDRSSSTDTISSAVEASETLSHANVSNQNQKSHKLQPPSKKKSKSKESINTVSTGLSSTTSSSKSSISPGPIDNNSVLVEEHHKVKVNTLTDEGGRLKDAISCGDNFELVPEPVWRALHHWYGGQPALPRIVPLPVENENPEIELYRLHIFLLRHQQNNNNHQAQMNVFPGSSTLAGMGNATIGMLKSSVNYVVGSSSTTKRYTAYRATFSRRHTIKQVQTFLSYRLHIHYDNIRLWNFIDENNEFVMEEETATLEDFGVKDNSQVLIEVRNLDMSWPEEMSQLAKNKKSKPKQAIEKGVTGLSNIGNTCFMNSSLQCISNTRPLTKYLQENKHLFELNRSNPLGMKGHIAKRYGDLVQDLWSGNSKSIAPLKLRWTISKYAPRFNGFAQHDSQELLAFLLDGLHEDLNRVQEKPYVELEDSDGRPDEEVAQEAWENHLMRNQSIIVDLFHGQIKSQVRCMECNTTSVRFDPFTFLSLPLPMDNSMYLNIILVRLNGETPVKYGICLSMEDKYHEVRARLSKLADLSEENLLLAEVFAAHVKSFISNNQKVRTTVSGNLYAFEIPSPQAVTLDIEEKNMPNGDAHKKTADIETKKGLRSLHETHKTSISNLNALYKEETQNSDSVREDSNSNVTNNYERSGEEESVKVTSFAGNNGPGSRQSYGPDTTVNGKELTNGTKDKPIVNGDIVHKPISNNIHSGQPSANPTTIKSQCYVIAFHRKTFHQDIYFLSPQKIRMSLFGVPLVVPCVPGQPKSTLYKNVWKQVSRLVSPLPPSDSANHAQDCDDSLHMQYPFILRSVKQCGNLCGEGCPWFRFCRGCVIDCKDEPYHSQSGYIAIDWDPTALHLRYQPSMEREVTEHASVAEGTQGQRKPIDLDQCLRAFTTEEELGANELYYCGKCKKHQLAKKKLDIWRLPPILIIHLKRFQFVNGHWIKSHKVVNVSKTKFDPSNFMTKRENSNELKQLEIREEENKDVTSFNGDSSASTSTTNDVSKNAEKRITFADEAQCCDNGAAGDIKVQSTPEPKHTGCHSAGTARERKPSFREESQPLYDLYALSCHTGILCGGHYVSFAKNPNNKWYCYNDSSCKEVKEDEISVDTSYMLFYERKDLDYDEFMPQTEGKSQIDTESMDDDFNSEYKKYCTIQ